LTAAFNMRSSPEARRATDDASMSETGELVDWNDARGFGFVRAADGARLFVHISAFQSPSRRPLIGDRVRFRRGPGREGRPAVIAAQLLNVVNTPEPDAKVERAQTSRALRIALAAMLILMIVLARRGGHAPLWLILPYIAAGVLSAAAYWVDKRAARAGRWRVAETTLHVLDFAGGVVGGLLAQAALRHKTAKPGFSGITLLIASAHIVFLAALTAGLLDLVRPD
jgi:uncharacterized membrane protein YsdA (DUF1294 family)/cold shock CspA family protein